MRHSAPTLSRVIAMTKRGKLCILAAVSAALLLGGALIYYHDDVAQKHIEDSVIKYKPTLAVRNELDKITSDLITETAALKDTNSEAATETEAGEIPVISASDTLPDNVRQSLIDSVQALQSAYPDCIGWLYIPDTSIDEPVMRCNDNDYYLNHAFDGSSLQAGSVFLDCRCEGRFMNPINILYSHNMRNGSMFADIPKYSEESFFEAHKYGWLATPETVYRIDFFSCAKAGWKDLLYDGGISLSEWIPHIFDCSAVSREITYSDEDRFISLSTCSYEFQNARTILTGKLTETNGG